MRKNVLIFSHGYKNGFIEASNQYSRLFDPDKFDITVVYLDGEPNEQIQKKHVANKVLFLNAPLRDKRGLKLPIIKKMLALHRTKKFHIVICHRYKPTYIMLWVAKFCKIPILFCIIHEMKAFKYFSRKLTMSVLAQKNIMLAGVSNAVRDDLQHSLLGRTKDRVITLYNTIDIDATKSELLSRHDARHQLNLPEDCFTFGILGRLVPAKDHNTLIEAFAIIKPHCPLAKLVIIGEGELESPLKNQIQQHGLVDDVILTGFLPKAFSLLKAFDVFVLSSIKEAFGRVLLEAMVAKCPIIATKTDGIPEVMGDIGTLVEKQNPQALAYAMMNFYNMTREERQIQSELSYQRAHHTFSIENFKETFWNLPLFNSI